MNLIHWEQFRNNNNDIKIRVYSIYSKSKTMCLVPHEQIFLSVKNEKTVKLIKQTCQSEEACLALEFAVGVTGSCIYCVKKCQQTGQSLTCIFSFVQKLMRNMHEKK